MRRLIATAMIAVAPLLAGTGLCAAQPLYAAGQPPPRSFYPDGTGNVAVDALNAGQLDGNYRGPWRRVAAGRARPAYAAPVYATPAYGTPVYRAPAYPASVYPAPVYYAAPAFPPGG